MSRPAIAVLAEDLVWADRLGRAVKAAGGRPLPARTTGELDGHLATAGRAIVDLTARSYDPVEAVGRAARAGAGVLAVGPHDDVELRKRALAAGADKVLAYRKLFEDGPATIRRWIDAADRGPALAAPAAEASAR